MESSQSVSDQWRVNNSRGISAQTRQRIGTWSTEENKESACEELMQCAYSKIQSVVINCEDFKCDYKVVCAVKYSDIQSVIIHCNPVRQLTNKSEY
jgi:hypothetical protein